MAAPPSPYDTVLLVGFMGSGKSTVGQRVAERLGWELVDVDEAVERRTGRSIEEIFRERGEEAFRALEEDATREALRRPGSVVVPGGGWAAAAPGRMTSLDESVLTVWLGVTPEEAVERAARQGVSRPLLDVPDPVARARELLDVRAPRYREARLHMDTVGASPDDLARTIVEHVRSAQGTAIP